MNLRKLVNDVTGAKPKTKDENFEANRTQFKTFQASVRKLKDVVEKFSKDIRNIPKDFSEAATQFDNLTGGSGNHPCKGFAAGIEAANSSFVNSINGILEKVKTMHDRLFALEKKIKERDDALMDLEHKQGALETAQRSGKSDKISDAQGKADAAKAKFDDIHSQASAILADLLQEKESWSDDVYNGWAAAHAEVFYGFYQAKQ
eukprot:TRINITY_DN3602_c0_g1_i2.p1 TRINITY_DN3602_c0_g1~~TRINITY_DN3602_c0_g1_i2.p1  ORF type:complete len:204 (-),score=82.13 TRINITY_DN3602_c0_g1_i2:40-651(-)